MIRRDLAALAVALLACTPTRDNPFDPANAPAVSIDVVERAGCSTTDEPDLWPEVPVARRTDCLALDARDTRDPSGRAAEDLFYTFEQVDSDGNRIGGAYQIDGPPLLLLSSAQTKSLVPGTIVRFRGVAEVERNGSGGSGSAITTLLVQNGLPVAERIPWTTYPRGGYAWSPGAPFVHVLTAQGTDPDGDAITRWRWSDRAGAVLGTSATLQVTLPATDGGREIALRVGDDFDFSTPMKTKVRVGAPSVWTFQASGGGTLDVLERFDSEWRRVSVHPDLDQSTALARRSTPQGDRVLAITSNSIQLLDWPDELLDSATLSFLIDGIAIDPATPNAVWAVSEIEGLPGASTRRVTKYSTDGYTITVGADVVIPSAVDADPSLVAGRGVRGYAEWSSQTFVVSSFLARAVNVFGPDLAPLGSWIAPPGTAVTGLDARPGSGETWAVAGQSFTGTIPGTIAFERLSVGTAGLVVKSFHLDEPDASGLAWIDEATFWTSVPGRGLCRVDAASIEAGRSFDQSVLETIPIELPAADFVITDGEAFAWSRISDYVVTLRAGEPALFASRLVPFFVEESGRIGAIEFGFGDGPATSSLSPDSGHRLVRLATGSTTAPSMDPFDGSLWVVSTLPRALRHVAEDGTTLDVMSEIDFGTDVEVMPTVLGADTDPHGLFWMQGIDLTVGQQRLLVLDLDAPRPAEAPWRVPGQNLADLALFVHAIEAFDLFAVEPAAWIQTGPFLFGTSWDLLRATLAGPPTSIFAFNSSSQTYVGMSAVPGTNELCHVTTDGAANSFLRRIPAGAMSAPAATTLSGRARAAGASPAYCWTASGILNVGTGKKEVTVRAYDTAGTLARSATWSDPLSADWNVLSMRVISDDEAWVLASPDTAPSDFHLLQFRLTGGTTVEVVAVGSSNFFVP